MVPCVARVGPRTVEPREPRQVRKEAAAAGAPRVAEPSGPGGIFLHRVELSSIVTPCIHP